ncbi:hypothetical protein JL722_14235 [Aureococcus anophagefferens]|nr:hypothetical protein JL722_14235 [Aureococcus anophagefferens]
MHARGVMHQDVKPANLLLDAAGKRLAFTTSALGDPWVPAFAGRVVRAAFTGCTPRYLSPEGLRVHAVLGRAASRDEYEGLRRRHAMTPAVSDCWAAGLVILELHKPRDAAWRPGDAGDVAREALTPLRRRRLAERWRLAARRSQRLAGGDGAMAARLAGAVAPAATGAALDALLGDDDAAAASFPRAALGPRRARAAAARAPGVESLEFSSPEKGYWARALRRHDADRILAVALRDAGRRARRQGPRGAVPPALPRLAAGRLRDLDLTLNRFRGDCPPDLLRSRLAHGCAVHLDESSRLGPAALGGLGELPDLLRADASPLPATLATFRFSNNAFEGDLRAVAPLCALAARSAPGRYNRLAGRAAALLALRHAGRGADVRLGGNLGFEIDDAGGAALAARAADALDLRDCSLGATCGAAPDLEVLPGSRLGAPPRPLRPPRRVAARRGDALAALERLDLGNNRLDGAAGPSGRGSALRRRNRFTRPRRRPRRRDAPALAACDLSENPLPRALPAALPPAAVLGSRGLRADAVAELHALAVLELADNAIAAVPPALGDLAGLRVLRLDGNLLTAIPPALGKLAGTLRRCSLHGNNIVGSLGALGALATASMGDDDDADAASSEDDDECDVD